MGAPAPRRPEYLAHRLATVLAATDLRIGGCDDPEEAAVGTAARLDRPGGRQPSAGAAPADGRAQAHLLVRNDARKQPAELAKYLATKDYYHRHVLNPEGVSVYVAEGRDAESLPESIKNEIRRQLKGQS